MAWIFFAVGTWCFIAAAFLVRHALRTRNAELGVRELRLLLAVGIGSAGILAVGFGSLLHSGL